MSQCLIRPARPTDLGQVHEIYNYYVLNTVSTFHHHTPPFQSIVDTFDTATTNNLPYLVATAPDSETVLGFAYATPFRPPKLAYAVSIEITIYVDTSHRGFGTGRLLLTGLLGRLRGCKYSAAEPGHEDRVLETEIRNVYAVTAHDVNGPEKQVGDRLIAWYERSGFEVVGRLKHVGWKFERWIDVVMLQLDLEEIGHSGTDLQQPPAATVR